MKIWFRAGMEADITEEEMNVLLSNDERARHHIMYDIIKRSELSGETYIVGKNYGGVEDYDNPDEEICFEF